MSKNEDRDHTKTNQGRRDPGAPIIDQDGREMRTTPDDLRDVDDEAARKALAARCAEAGHPLTIDRLGMGFCECGAEHDLLYMVSPSQFMKKPFRPVLVTDPEELKRLGFAYGGVITGVRPPKESSEADVEVVDDTVEGRGTAWTFGGVPTLKPGTLPSTRESQPEPPKGESSPPRADLPPEPRPEDFETEEEATREQIVSALRRLVEEGGSHNFVVFEAVKTGGRSANYYVQFATSCGSAEIYGEAVSNYYLERPFTLGKRQKAELARLGWNPPRRGKHPNYYRYWQVLNDRDLRDIATAAIAALRSVYGWPGDRLLEVKLHLDW